MSKLLVELRKISADQIFFIIQEVKNNLCELCWSIFSLNNIKLMKILANNFALALKNVLGVIGCWFLPLAHLLLKEFHDYFFICDLNLNYIKLYIYIYVLAQSVFIINVLLKFFLISYHNRQSWKQNSVTEKKWEFEHKVSFLFLKLWLILLLHF